LPHGDRNDCIDLATTLTMEEMQKLLSGSVSPELQADLAEKLLAAAKETR